MVYQPKKSEIYHPFDNTSRLQFDSLEMMSLKGGYSAVLYSPVLGYNILIGRYDKLIIILQLTDNQLFSLIYSITQSVCD